MQPTATPRFNRLVELYYEPLFHFAASLCGRPEPALVLTQRTFHLAQERAGRQPSPPDVKPWLFTILFREFLESRRRHLNVPGTPV